MYILCIYYSLAIVLWQQAIPPSPLPPSLFFPICRRSQRRQIGEKQRGGKGGRGDSLHAHTGKMERGWVKIAQHSPPLHLASV